MTSHPSKRTPKVSCILPSHNERGRIKSVLEVLTQSTLIDQLIVTDDSTDGTLEDIIPFKHRIDTLLVSAHKQGKGQAVREALNHVKHEVTLLIDADIHGLEERHLARLILPVLHDQSDLCIGIFHRLNDHYQFLRMNSFAISGQRAIKTAVLRTALADPLANEYGLEITMNYHCRIHGLRTSKITLFGADDQPKFVKHGLRKGGMEFIDETLDVLSRYSQLYLLRYPRDKARSLQNHIDKRIPDRAYVRAKWTDAQQHAQSTIAKIRDQYFS